MPTFISIFETPELVLFSGGSFEELFHSDFSEFVEVEPIIDSIAPNCPTNLSVHINTLRKEFLFTWYYPLSTNASDDSIQNDVKEFEFLSYDRSLKEFSIVEKLKVPRYLFKVPDELFDRAFNEGLSFSVRAIDYHDLVSKTSQIIKVRLNKDYGCKKKELLPEFLTFECGETEERTRLLSNKMIIKKDRITFSPGLFVSLKEPYRNKSNTLLVTIRDLNTGEKFTFNLTITHNDVLHLRPTFASPTSTISHDVIDSIRRGDSGGSGRFGGGDIVPRI